VSPLERPPLVHAFQWSLGQARLLKECPRKLFWRYYEAWGGWEPGSPERSRLCYRLSKMQDLDLLAANVVRQVIAQTVGALAAGRPAKADAEMERAARNLLNQAWLESREGRWRENPKRFANLFEHYYGVDIPPDRIEQVRALVLANLAHFRESQTLRDMQQLPAAAWVEIEAFPSLKVGPAKVGLKIDAAYTRGEMLYLVDWRTGQRAELEDEDLIKAGVQMLYAARALQVEPHRVTVVMEYLRDSTQRTFTGSAALLSEVTEWVTRRAAELAAFVGDTAANQAQEEAFPRTSWAASCYRCSFYEVCYGTRALQTVAPTSQG
jgi:hypothetical protein